MKKFLRAAILSIAMLISLPAIAQDLPKIDDVVAPGYMCKSENSMMQVIDIVKDTKLSSEGQAVFEQLLAAKECLAMYGQIPATIKRIVDLGVITTTDQSPQHFYMIEADVDLGDSVFKGFLITQVKDTQA